ncbi:MAG: benzoate-CoA ligase family protein [Kofleriaceae bacterium]|nr:benzoate-CoA ligase family protein [Kofleriaceae bacterium]
MSGNLAGWMLERFVAPGMAERVALRQGERQLTYAEVSSLVGRISDVLRGLGLSRGERVALFMRDTMETAASILGIMHAGGVAVPLSELMTAADVKRYLVHCGAAVAIVEARLEPLIDEVRVELPTLREILCVGLGDQPASERGERDFFSAVARANANGAAVPCAPTDPAMLLYSAGFAAEDLRAVPHSKATVIAAFESCARGLFGLAESDCVLSVGRLTTAYGLGSGLLFPLLAGAQAILFPDQPKSEALFRHISEMKPTVLFATPSIYSQLTFDRALAGPKPLANLRLAVAGAEGMPEHLIPKIRTVLGTEVVVGYGLTELFQFVLAGRSDDRGNRAGVCGQPLPGVNARVIDDDGEQVEPNEIGTLQLAAGSMFAGYWPATLTNGDIGADGWFTTHDRFLVDSNGEYHHCGRVDDLFKVGGKWVSPVEVERALTAHDAVWECAVIGAEDEEGLIKPLAFVVTNVGRQGGPALEAELQEYVKTVLAPYKYPRWIDFVDALPRGPGGKILRYKLKPQRRRRRAETGHG